MSANLPAIAPKTVVPKPTKREILMATAYAISEKRVAENEVLHKAENAAWKAFTKEFIKAARKKLPKCDGTVSDWGGTFNCEFNVKVDVKGCPKLSALHEAYKVATKAKRSETDVKKIADELRWSMGPVDRVALILADPDTKAALLKAGEKVLASVSADDRANAVDVGGAR